MTSLLSVERELTSFNGIKKEPVGSQGVKDCCEEARYVLLRVGLGSHLLRGLFLSL